MSADYQVAHPVATQAFLDAQGVRSIQNGADVDPWLFSNTHDKEQNIDWGIRSARRLARSPIMFTDERAWSSPTSPMFAARDKGVAVPLSALNLDPWAHAIHQSEEDGADDGSQEDSSGDDLNLYKTELCRSFAETGTCRYGLKCQFAHGQSELRPVSRHPKYKTEICKTFHTQGTCPYGTRCRFIHIRGNRNIVSVPTTPNSSPPQKSIHFTRSPSPPDFVPKWATNASVATPPIPMPHPHPLQRRYTTESLLTQDQHNEGDGNNEGGSPPASTSGSSSPKKRLAIFRTISKDKLW